jgi:ATP/maltotriose-dependent transcriptional regulator MalT
LEVYQQTTQPIDKGYVAIALIEKYANKNMDSAFFFANEALKISNVELDGHERQGAPNGLKGTALFNLAVLNHQTAVYDKAKAYYLEAVNYLRKGGEEKLLAKNISYLGRIYEREGKPELFREKTLEAIQIQEGANDSNGLAYSYTSLGDYYARKNDHDSCQICYKKVFELLEQTGDLRSLAFSLQNYGGRLKARREYPEAIQKFYRALAIQKKINDKSGMLYTLLNIGSVHKDLSEYEKASKYYQEAFEVNQTVKDKSVEAKLLYNQGDIFSNQKKYNKAIEKYSQALALMRQINIGPNVIANCITDLARENIKVNQYSKALNYIEEALNLGRGISMPEDLAIRHLTKADIKIKLNNLEVAQLHLDTAIDLGQTANLKAILSQGYLLKSRLAEKTGDYKNALAFLNIHNGFKDSLNLISTERLLLRKEANYQIEQSKKENELNLQKIDLLKREKILNNRLIYGLVGLLITLGLIGFLMFKNYKQKREAKELEVKNQLQVSNSELITLRERINTMLLADKGKLENINITQDVNQFLDEPLSTRELDVLNELSTGKSNQEISEALFVSVNTVRTHLMNIYNKLDVKNRTQAVKKAANLNLT